MEQMGTKVNLNGKQWEQGRQRGIRGTIMGTRGKDGTNGNKSEFKWETMGTRETKGTRDTKGTRMESMGTWEAKGNEGDKGNKGGKRERGRQRGTREAKGNEGHKGGTRIESMG